MKEVATFVTDVIRKIIFIIFSFFKSELISSYHSGKSAQIHIYCHCASWHWEDNHSEPQASQVETMNREGQEEWVFNLSGVPKDLYSKGYV